MLEALFPWAGQGYEFPDTCRCLDWDLAGVGLGPSSALACWVIWATILCLSFPTGEQ